MRISVPRNAQGWESIFVFCKRMNVPFEFIPPVRGDSPTWKVKKAFPNPAGAH